MDQCDSIADEIDTLEKNGFAIEELEKTYHCLLVSINALQEKLEAFAEEEMLF